MTVEEEIVREIEFTPDCQNKWDFDGRVISISSRGYDWDEKSFNVGYYLGEDLEPIIEDELFDEDFDILKAKVKQWYRDHLIEALEKAIKMIREELEL